MQSNAVQQRIKRMMKQKKLAKQGHFQSQIRKRVLSQNFFQNQDNDTSILRRHQNQQDEKSIRTEWRKRNTETQKYRETENSEATTNETIGQAKNSKVQVEKVVGTIFSYSPKLTQYLQQYKMKRQEAMVELMASELFVLGLTSKLGKIQTDTDSSVLNSIVENQIILKLTKINRKKKQSLSCCDIQNRITSLINRRLDTLRKY